MVEDLVVLKNKAIKWRRERIEKLQLDAGCVKLKNDAKIVLHVIPLCARTISNSLPMKVLEEQKDKVLPLSAYALKYSYNSNGLLASSSLSGSNDSTVLGYAQFF